MNTASPPSAAVAIIAWTSAAFGVIVISEWFIHLPAFNVLLGFPVQLLGLVCAFNLAYKYYIEKEGTLLGYFEALVERVSEELPGLGK